MNHPPSLTLAAISAAIGVAIAMASCSGGNAKSESEAGLLKSAAELSAKHDYKTALIHLRNAIQLYPNSPEVRLAMGKLLLGSGDAAAAGVELEKALALKAPEDEVLPALARALLASGESARIPGRFEQTQLGSPAAQAELLSVVAAAQLQMGQQRNADATLARALSADPGAPGALLMQARRQAARGEVQDALVSLERARDRHPEKAQLLQFEGELLLLGKRDIKGAESAFMAAVQARSDYAPAHAGLVGLALQQQDKVLAKQRLDQMVKAAPRHPQTLLVQGQLALLEGQLDTAQDKAQQLMRMAPEDLRVLTLAGEAALRNGAFAQGESYLLRVIQRAPDGLGARKLLAQAHLKNGNPGAAIEILKPVVENGKADGTALALAAQAHLKEGQTTKALPLFKKARELNPDDTRIRSAYALAQFGRGQPQAIAELESLAATDDGVTADLALISARLQQGDHEGALKAIRSMERKQTDQPLAANLEGRVLLMQGKPEAARVAMERALKLDPKHLTSALALVSLDVQEGRPEAGTARLEALAQREPRNEQILLALADHRARLGAPGTEVDEILQRAVKAAPDSTQARIALVQRRLERGQHDSALKAAQEAVAAIQNRPELMQILARAQLATGDRQQAAATLRKLVTQDPQNTGPLLQLAELHALMDEPSQVRQTLKRILDLQPENLDAQRRLIALELAARETTRALEVARQIQRQRPKEPIGLIMEGDIAASTQSWDSAIKSYRNANKLSPSTDGAVRLHAALLAAERKADARSFVSEWEKSNPKDVGFQMHLGDQAAAQRQWETAEKHFARAARIDPRNGLALNNLAYAMAMQSKREAIEPAHRALELMPGQAAVMDTMALALAADRQLDKALALQKKAVDREGASAPALRLTLARLYLQAGDKSAARQELQSLAGLGSKFPEQREVSELLKSI